MTNKMTNRSKLLILQLFIGLFLSSCQNDSHNEIINRKEFGFNENWNFRKDGQQNWEKVVIPHTVNVEPLIVNDQWQDVSRYEKEFTIDQDPKDKRAFLEFEGIMQEAGVWLNDQFIIKHEGGYLPFSTDLTSPQFTRSTHWSNLKLHSEK